MFKVFLVSGLHDRAPDMASDPDVRDEVDAACIMRGYSSLESFQRANGLPLGFNPETLDALGVEFA
jgi:hypothetical protein